MSANPTQSHPTLAQRRDRLLRQVSETRDFLQASLNAVIAGAASRGATTRRRTIRGSPLGSLTGFRHLSASENQSRMDNLLRDHI